MQREEARQRHEHDLAKQAEIAAEAAADAERAAAEQVARDAAEQAERNALLEAEQKAARDARYAARKAAKKQGGGAISPKPCALPAALDPQRRMSEMKPRERPSASPPNDGRLL